MAYYNHNGRAGLYLDVRGNMTWLHSKQECGDCGSTEADARARWAVRVLDAWAEEHICSYIVAPTIGIQCAWNVYLSPEYVYRSDTPDAARIAAATALVAADPSLDPDGGK